MDRDEHLKSLNPFQVFRWMQRQKWFKQNDGFYPKLIVIMGKAKQLRMAVWLFSEAKRNGHRPDTSFYNALITAHLHNRDKRRGFQKALQLLEDMKQRARYVYFLAGCSFPLPKYCTKSCRVIYFVFLSNAPSLHLVNVCMNECERIDSFDQLAQFVHCIFKAEWEL